MTTTSVLQPVMTHSSVSPRGRTAIIELGIGCGSVMCGQEMLDVPDEREKQKLVETQHSL